MNRNYNLPAVCYSSIPSLVIVRGLPGSGKSTAIMKLRDMLYKYYAAGEADVHHYEADMFFMNPQTGKYEFDRRKLQEAHEWCLERTLSALSFTGGMKRWVFVGNTFVSAKEIMRYYESAEKFATVFILECSGDYGSVHDVPKETIDRMRRRFVSKDFLFNFERNVHIGNYTLHLIKDVR